MPQTKSAKKRMRQAQKRTQRNRRIKNRVKNAIKDLIQLVSQGNFEKAKEKLPQVITLIDSAWGKGVWHKNKAARVKSRLMKKFNKALNQSKN